MAGILSGVCWREREKISRRLGEFRVARSFNDKYMYEQQDLKGLRYRYEAGKAAKTL